MNKYDIQRGQLLDKNPVTSTDNAEINQLKQTITNLQLDVDILKETLNVLKKDQSINLQKHNNREKTVIVDALLPLYSLDILR